MRLKRPRKYLHLLGWVPVVGAFVWLGSLPIDRNNRTANAQTCGNNPSLCSAAFLHPSESVLFWGVILAIALAICLILVYIVRRSNRPLAMSAHSRRRSRTALPPDRSFKPEPVEDWRSSQPPYTNDGSPPQEQPRWQNPEDDQTVIGASPWDDPAEARTHLDLVASERQRIEQYLDRLSGSRVVRSTAETTGNLIRLKITHPRVNQPQEKLLTPETLLQGGGLIGRHPNCDIVLGSPEVSRVHGRILYRAGQFYFTDLGSTAGSQVNHKKAQTNQNFVLQPQDVICIGRFTLSVQEVKLDQEQALPQEPAPPDANMVPVQRLIYTAEELKAQGIPIQGISEFDFQGKVLVEGLTLSKRFRQRAMEVWQSELDAGNFCLLVEYSDHLTLWIEKQNEPS